MTRIDHPTAADLPQLRELWLASFSDTDAYLDIFFSTAFSPARCMCVRISEQIAAAAYWMDCIIDRQPAAYIYAVATVQHHQGKGLCRMLMDAIHSHLHKLGYCGSILVPADDELRRMYGKMGYIDFGGIRESICACGPGVANLQRICKERYAQLRRSYLQPTAVLQEGECLALLDALAEFYQGNDYLLTVSDNMILEFLGNPEALPGAVAALGMQQITVRADGSNHFAMYRPLTKTVFPTYFAFAFD